METEEEVVKKVWSPGAYGEDVMLLGEWTVSVRVRGEREWLWDFEVFIPQGQAVG